MVTDILYYRMTMFHRYTFGLMVSGFTWLNFGTYLRINEVILTNQKTNEDAFMHIFENKMSSNERNKVMTFVNIILLC
jgi:hypothetical protein